jgi:hypothetical protein
VLGSPLGTALVVDVARVHGSVPAKLSALFVPLVNACPTKKPSINSLTLPEPLIPPPFDTSHVISC